MYIYIYIYIHIYIYIYIYIFIHIYLYIIYTVIQTCNFTVNPFRTAKVAANGIIDYL